MEGYQEKSKEEKPLELSSSKVDELKTLILSDYEVSNSARGVWLEAARRGLNLYYGIKPPKSFPFVNCANVHVPLIKTIQSTLESNILGSLDYEKPITVIPVGPEDFDKSRAIERLLNWQFTSQVDYRSFMDKLVHSTLLYGHTFVKVRYVVEKKNNKTTFDGIKLDIPNPEYILFPPDASSDNPDDWDYVIHELYLTLSDLKRREQAGIYKNVKEVQELLQKRDGGSKQIPSMDLEEPRKYASGIESEEVNSNRKRGLRIVEWYGYFDLDEDGIEEAIMVTIALDSKTLLRCVQTSAKRPFVLVRFNPILNKVTGESVPGILAEINDEVNTIHNQRVDAVTITNIPFFFFDPMAGFNPNNIQLTPGLGIPVNGSPSQAVYFPSLSTVKPEMYKEEEILNLIAERLVGAGANTQGVIQTKRVSATEIAAIDKRAGVRFLTILNRIKAGITKTANLVLSLDKEFLPDEVSIRVIGLDLPIQFKSIYRKDIQGNVDVLINGNSIVDEQSAKSDQFQVYQMSLTNPLIMSDETALYEVTKDTYAKMGVKRIDAYLRRPASAIPRMPSEEHNLLAQGEEVHPNLADNHEGHIRDHEEFIVSEEFKILSKEAQLATLSHLQETKKMYNIIRQLQVMQQLQAVNSQLLQIDSGTHPSQTGVENQNGEAQPSNRAPSRKAARPGLGA